MEGIMQNHDKDTTSVDDGYGHNRRNCYTDPYGDYLKLTNASSATDMTGLIPAVLTSEAEAEFYDEMYQFLPVPEDKEK